MNFVEIEAGFIADAKHVFHVHDTEKSEDEFRNDILEGDSDDQLTGMVFMDVKDDRWYPLVISDKTEDWAIPDGSEEGYSTREQAAAILYQQ